MLIPTGRALALVTLGCLAACHKPVAEPAGDAKPVAQVRTAVLTASAMAREVVAYGAAETPPGDERTLAAPVEARVVQVLAPAGSMVGAGDPVVILTASPQSQLDQQKATQDQLTGEAAFARAQRLRASGLVSDAEVEATRAAAATARATLTGLKGRLAGLVLRAPLRGVVESVTAAPGDLVAQGAGLARIGALGRVIVRVGVEPDVARSLHVGMPVRVAPLQGGADVVGAVSSLDLRVDATTRLASVLVSGLPLGVVSPGQPVRAAIVVGRANGESAPRSAIYYDHDQPYVLTVSGGVAHKAEVKLGPEKDGRVEVVGGLKGGDRIIIDGGASLDDGALVREAPVDSVERGAAAEGAGA